LNGKASGHFARILGKMPKRNEINDLSGCISGDTSTEPRWLEKRAIVHKSSLDKRFMWLFLVAT